MVHLEWLFLISPIKATHTKYEKSINRDTQVRFKKLTGIVPLVQALTYSPLHQLSSRKSLVKKQIRRGQITDVDLLIFPCG